MELLRAGQLRSPGGCMELLRTATASLYASESKASGTKGTAKAVGKMDGGG